MAHRFSPRSLGRKGGIALGAAALLAVGGIAGAVASGHHGVTMAPATPVAIRALGTEGIVTIRGRVAEVYGNHFILADGSGRALVDAGHDDDSRVAVGQPITVQGRYYDGFVRAAFLVDADGKVEQVGRLDGPPRHGGHDRHGPGGRRDDDRGPPPPPAGTVPPPVAADGRPAMPVPVTAAPAATPAR